MSFDPNSFFDNDKILAAMEKAKDALRNAADADTGSAKPLFQELYKEVSEMIDNPAAMENPQDMMKSAMKLFSLPGKLRAEAQNNPAAQAAFIQLEKDLRASMSDVFDIKSIFNKFSGGGAGFDIGKLGDMFGGFGAGKKPEADETPNDNLPSPPKAKKPKKPDGNDFTI